MLEDVGSWLQAAVMAEAAKVRLCDPKPDVDLSGFAEG
jgi:hypothetical protein